MIIINVIYLRIDTVLYSQLRYTVWTTFRLILYFVVKGSSPDGITRAKLINFPVYIDRYHGRSNQGIPCFTDERLYRRMAKVHIIAFIYKLCLF